MKWVGKNEPLLLVFKNASGRRTVVFTSLSHLLTLIAFATHAVVGCCGHHAHCASVECHEHAAVTSQPDGSASDGACVHKGCCSHAASPHNISQPAISQPAISQPAVSTPSFQSNCSEGQPSSDHSHTCRGADCAYVLDSIQCLERSSHHFSALVECAGSPFVMLCHDPCRDAVQNLGSLPRTYPRTSCARCALLQSWQV
jgi:hypothetical protein